MKRFAKVDNTSVLQQHYEKKVLELEQEKKSLMVLFLPLILKFPCFKHNISYIYWQLFHFKKIYVLAIDRKKLMTSEQILQTFPLLLMMVLKS